MGFKYAKNTLAPLYMMWCEVMFSEMGFENVIRTDTRVIKTGNVTAVPLTNIM